MGTKRLADSEARIEKLGRQREDAAGTVEGQFREMLDLRKAVAEATIAFRSGNRERAFRQRAAGER